MAKFSVARDDEPDDEFAAGPSSRNTHDRAKRRLRYLVDMEHRHRRQRLLHIHEREEQEPEQTPSEEEEEDEQRHVEEEEEEEDVEEDELEEEEERVLSSDRSEEERESDPQSEEERREEEEEEEEQESEPYQSDDEYRHRRTPRSTNGGSTSSNFYQVNNNNNNSNLYNDDDIGNKEGEGSFVMTLSDPDVLDCPICIDPLTLPVFQCENGHIACSSCSAKVRNKCPSCSLPIGYNRCRAMEQVIESVKVSCRNFKYGCFEKASYCSKNDHEKKCTYAPCSCPQLFCNFIGSWKQLSAHLTCKHPNVAKRFRFNTSFSITFEPLQKSVILQEERGGQLFFVCIKEIHSLGNVISVSAIQPSTSKERFLYNLVAEKGEYKVRLDSIADNVVGRVEIPDRKRFLMVPRDFFDSFGRLKVELLVRNQNLDVPILSSLRKR